MLSCVVSVDNVLCCRMGGKFRTVVHPWMIVLVLEVLRCVVVVVMCCIYSVIGWC